MKKMGYGSLTLALMTLYSIASAMPAPTPAATVQPWSGLYVGANLGGAWTNKAVPESGSTIEGIGSIQTAIDNGAIPQSLAKNPSGALGGFEANYNYGINQLFIVGAAIDFDWANVYANQTINTNLDAYFPLSTSARQTLASLGTVRVLLGITPPIKYPLMVYITGGFAYGKKELTGSIVNDGCEGICGRKYTSSYGSGWTAGAGMEYALTDFWILKAEYLYYSLGSLSQHVIDPRFTDVYLAQNVTYAGNVARFGVDYKIT